VLVSAVLGGVFLGFVVKVAAVTYEVIS
jgi:hypothetical protein